MNIHDLAMLRINLDDFCKHLTEDSNVPVDMQDLAPEILVFIHKKLDEELSKGKQNGSR